MHFKNVTSSPLPVFFGHCTGKNKDVALKFRMRVVCMHFDHIYSGFLKISPGLEFILRNQNFWWKNLKILRFFHFGNFEIAAFFARPFYTYEPILKSLGC